MAIQDLGQLLVGIAAVGSLALQLRNAFKSGQRDVTLKQIHESTNGMSIRTEALAKKLGVEEGIAIGKAGGSS